MIYSVGCEYAIRALTQLAIQQSTGKFCLLREIIEGDDLPQHFVGKIFQTLVRADILQSAKGRGGGFALSRPAEKIKLREIVDAIDGPNRLSRCILGLTACDNDQPCPQHDRWMGIRNQIGELLDRTSVADLAAALSKKQAKSSPRRR